MNRSFRRWRVLLTAILILALALAGCVREQPGAQLSPGQGAQAGAASPSQTPIATPGGESVGAAEATEQASSAREAEPPFTVVWMSDTQKYAQKHPEIFLSMSDWIVENAARLNTKYVLHTGDVVHKRGKAKQWKNALAATDPIMAALPLFVTAGNHDAWPDSYAEFDERYGPAAFLNQPSATGFYKGGMARYDLFSVGSHDFIIAGIGYYHDEVALNFIDAALKAHPGSTAILCLHSYLNADASFTEVADELHQLVLSNPNVKLVLCGHRQGVSRRVFELDDDGDGAPDRQVLAMLANYQGEKKGGEGFLHILTFDPASGRVSAEAYSPYLDELRKADEGIVLW